MFLISVIIAHCCDDPLYCASSLRPVVIIPLSVGARVVIIRSTSPPPSVCMRVHVRGRARARARQLVSGLFMEAMCFLIPICYLRLRRTRSLSRAARLVESDGRAYDLIY